MSKQKLGRGLEAILSPLTSNKTATPAEHIVKIAIDKIKPNRHQPRLNFNEDKLQELAESIKQNGLLEPILVIQSIAPGEYELIAGERRLRASKLAGLKDIKAIVKTSASDKEKLDIALIENIQREDLNPIEEATAYKKYAEDYKYTQEQIAQIVNKNRSVVANTMRLLNLPNNIQNMIISGAISSGHGRMLAGITDESKLQELVKQIIEQGLTVRDIENIVSISKNNNKNSKAEKIKDIEIANLIEELQRLFGTKVEITGNGKKGKIIFNYNNLSDLERVSNILKK
ncbi:MAG: ParB/RepB/Spo0J family partition protein [Endomicrobiaceae bacterium]|nr:ParB/RepB/Spo0J family partition protein [Endomicrobiaceae bacterium]MDD5102610.1 ParB/RepB/Spo0J family partition protein [Endomicrobiaceae bacterium]